MKHDFAVTDGAWFKATTLPDALERIRKERSLHLIINGWEFQLVERQKTE